LAGLSVFSGRCEMTGIQTSGRLRAITESGRRAMPHRGRTRRGLRTSFRRQVGAGMPTTRRSGAVSIGSPGRSLDHVLAGVWEDLAACSRAECPVCGSEMSFTGKSGSCGGCGAELS